MANHYKLTIEFTFKSPTAPDVRISTLLLVTILIRTRKQ